MAKVTNLNISGVNVTINELNEPSDEAVATFREMFNELAKTTVATI
ncbi:MAG TPA: hypothetical protein VFC84_14785 [Desulfosporosinus sp.]|nr:hypothetical protein [Desulfosporosinus sp.]